MASSLLYGSVLLLAIYIIRNVLGRKRLPLPPGPKGLPLVGNIQDLAPPGEPEWQHWLKHKDLYGPLSSVTVLGQTIVLIHDKDMAFELLDKRAIKHSSRPEMVFASEMAGYKGWMGMQPYGKQLREQRKLAAQQVGSKATVAKFNPAVDLQVRRFLLRTLNRPRDLLDHLETEAGSLMLDTLYGYTPSPYTPDPLVKLINKVMAGFGESCVPGAYLVDLVPWLQHVPDWVPGTGFKQKAKQMKRDYVDVVNIPLNFVAQQMARGSAKPSYVSGLLDQEPDAEKRHNISYSASALYAGGADTTNAALAFFFLAMMLFPEVQVKAREEIDRVIGSGRLPEFKDRENLPYIAAVVQETLRWQPIAPLGLPHKTDEDDEFHGYRIPKGSITMAAVKWFLSDPAIYKAPESFRPERFLAPENEPSPSAVVFGFGRRICPGRLLADTNLFLTVAQSLAVFDIKKAVDETTGKEIEPPVGMTPGLVAHPKPFKWSVLPRSEKHAELIRRVEFEHPWEEGDAKELDSLQI
ncbi:cytochrome P450 [Xylariales sp. AK1849]|nr:cytochrome P450 [Xylariales sp. AK1849]